MHSGKDLSLKCKSYEKHQACLRLHFSTRNLEYFFDINQKKELFQEI